MFHRDGDWVEEVVDDRLYVIFPDYDRSFLERKLFDRVRKDYDSQRVTEEEEYRRLYQVGWNSGFLYATYTV